MKTMNLNLAGAQIYIRGGWASLCGLIISILLMVVSIWLGGWFFLAGLILFVIVCLANAFIVVQPDFAGFAIVLGKLPNESLLPGWHLVMPFITEVINEKTKQDTYEITISDIDTSEVYKMGFKIVIKFGINPYEIWRIAGHVAMPIAEKHLYPILRELLIKHISPLTCQKLKDDESLRMRVMEDVRNEFMDKVEELFLNLSGVGVSGFLQNVELLFNDFQYDPIFVQRINDLEAARIQAQVAEQQKKAQITEATAVAESTKIIAEADAEAIEKKGAADNRVLKRKGEILEKHGSVAEFESAKRTPQTLVVNGGGGGVTPVMDILKGLYPHKDDEDTTATPTTPTPTPTPPTP